MDDQDPGRQSGEVDKKIIGYRFDGGKLLCKEDKYIWAEPDGRERVMGQTSGRILWLLVQEASAHPGQLVKKETLLEFLPSKEALRMSICRIKKEYAPVRIITKRNEGYRIHTSTIEPVYAEEERQGGPDMRPAETAAPAEAEATAEVTAEVTGEVPVPPETERPPAKGAVIKKRTALFYGWTAGAVAALVLGIFYGGYGQWKKIKALDRSWQQARMENERLTEQINRLRRGPETRPGQKVSAPFTAIIGLPSRDPQPRPIEIELEKAYDALLLTVAVEGAPSTFWVEMADADQNQVLRREVKKDHHGTISVCIPKDHLKNETYRVRTYPAGQPSLANEFNLRVRIP